MSSILPTSRELVLPRSPSAHAKVTATGSVVIIGANGSGKTRLGAWLDLQSPQASTAHRIAAQKSLTVPVACSTSALDVAENILLFGNERSRGAAAEKLGNKWRSKPNTLLQDDYDKLLVYLFTEEFDTSTKYRQESKDPVKRGAPPETRLDIVKRIWEYVLPHRTLIVGGGRIEAHPKDVPTARYNAAEMSDGERVIFYLLGQCMAARRDSIVIVDEPELHLHRAVQGRLWDAIEAERPDCLFVYLTHDLDFAATRANATKVWVRGYDETQWDWHVLEANDSIPERLLFEILGSRKPVLFVEGERESLDSFIMSKAYPEFTVTPCGSAAAVIHTTQSFGAQKALHHLRCHGIIDRDFRSAEEVEYLEKRNVSCLTFSEIENVFLDGQVLRSVAESLHHQDVDQVVARASDAVFTSMTADRDRLVSAITAAQIERRLSALDAKALGVVRLEEAVQSLFSAIDVKQLFAATSAEVDGIISCRDYGRALGLYNNKGLIPTVAQVLGFKHNEFIPYVRRLLASKQNVAIIRALREALPDLSTIAG
jgi:hypothetical protein